MKLEIFDKIIFGDLQPFAIENQKEKKFENILNPSIKFPTSPEEYNKALLKIFYKHPNILMGVGYNINLDLKNNELVISNMKDHVFEPLIDLDLPPCFNTTTEYYHYIIKNEATCVLHALVNEVQKFSSEIDAKYLLKTTLNNIEYLLRSVSRELKGLPNDVPVYQTTGNETDEERIRKNTHFVFYTLKTTLIRLYFEVTTTFHTLFGEIGKSEEELYQQVIGETPPKLKGEELKMKLSIRRAEIFISEKESNKDKSLYWLTLLQNYYSKNQSNSKLLNTLTAVENRLYINNYTESPEPFTLTELYSPETSNKFFNEAKNEYKTEIDKLAFGHERYEKISDILDSLIEFPFNTFSPDEPLKYSIPRRIIQWLNQQKSLYQKNFTEVFTTSTEGIGKTTIPKPKKEKVSPEKSKAIARKQLHFFSGDNQQQIKIMSNLDFNRLVKYVDSLIETEKVPPISKKIPQIGIPTGLIRYTFYLIHKELYTTKKIKPEWIDFLHAVFKQFESSEWNTTKTKFSTKPPYYQPDIDSMKR